MSRLPNSFKTKAVGVSFVPGYPSNVYALERVAAERFLLGAGPGSPEPIPAVLVRNPDNEFDANAIEVHIPSLGDAAMLGHIPRTVAERLAPSLDDGDQWSCSINLVAIDPDHPNNPGVHLQIQRAGESDAF